jgi:hypothetical protein
MLSLDDGPGRDDLRDLQDGTQDWGKGRVYILYAITDANTIQAVVVHHTIHQSMSTLTGYSLASARSSPPTRLRTRCHLLGSNIPYMSFMGLTFRGVDEDVVKCY